MSGNVDIGVMTQVESIKNESGAGYHVEFVNSGLVSYQLNSQWTTYFEVYTRFGNEGPHGGIVLVGGGCSTSSLTTCNSTSELTSELRARVTPLILSSGCRAGSKFSPGIKFRFRRRETCHGADARADETTY